MKIYANELLLRGSFHVKATSAEQADRILNKNCANTIDAETEEWFTDMPACYRPRASFSTKFTAIGAVEGAAFVEVSKINVHAAQSRWARDWRGLKCLYSPLTPAYEQVPVYSADIDLAATAFIRASGTFEAEAIFSQLFDAEMNFLGDNSRWFSMKALEDEVVSDLPVVLSSALYLVGKSEGHELCQAWPAGHYRGPQFITMVDRSL